MNNECVLLFWKLYSYGVCSNVDNYYELYLINGSMYISIYGSIRYFHKSQVSI